MHRTDGPLRFICDASIEIYWGSAILQARVSEISCNEIFVEVSNPLWVGATFAAALMLQPQIYMNCIVRRIEPNRGMALQITFETPEASKRFADLLEKLNRTTFSRRP